jgi:predicted ATPase/tetratricopeptide (TPR) repeat protein
MNPERWQRVQILVEEALAQPESLRRAFVGASCGEDHELRDEVISLLDACARSPESPEPPTAWFGLLARSEHPRFERDQRVAHRYRIRRLVGRGGMGEVYEAWDEDLAIAVALKTLRLAGGTEAAHSRLRLEGILARSIWHPNVCRLYDLGRHGEGDDAAWFLTMELLHGVTLAEVLQQKGRLPLDRARYFGIQMAEGLEAAHQAGVVHRDFKPGNVIIVNRDGSEHAVVTDFGIARAASRADSPRGGSSDSQAGSGSLIGTPIYMAPEQVRGEEAGPAADIYALGIVLYEMVTGTIPFSGDSVLEAATRRLREDAPSPRRIVPDLDESWDAVILRCLAREPIERFRRAEEVASGLRGRKRVEIAESPDIFSRAAPPSLPAERDPFVGRGDESEDLRRAFAGNARLVTLVGAGGIGKTRLAIRYGWQSLGAWPGGVWFCNLADAWSLDGIASAIADSLGIQLGQGDPVGILGHAIAGRGRCLMILDNVDQVVDLAAATVEKWLARAGEARFLVTSREKLNLGEPETVLAVGGLPIEAGVELFVSRAQRLCPAIAVVGPEAESAREIVRILDGMPLAIELAAARMRVMTAVEIAARMRRRFSLLTGGASARHETMIIAIDSSWELLQPWEQSAWSQCAVFEGGFTIQAAERVIDLSGWPEAPWVVDVVQSLVDKSLLRTWVPAARPGEAIPEARFGMFAILQEYARMKLREGDSGTEGTSPIASIERVVEERHGEWYARYGTTDAIETLTKHGAPGSRPRVELELDNLVAACRRAVVRGDAATAVPTYRAAWAVLDLRGPFGAAVELGRNLMRGLSLTRDQEVQAVKALGQAEWYAGMMEEARAHSETALAIAREVLDRKTEARVLLDLGGMKASQGRMEEASADLEMAIEIAGAIFDQPTACHALNTLSVVRRGQGRMEKATACSEEALQIARQIGNARLEGTILGNLGLILQDQGRTGDARAHYAAALAIHHKVGHRRFEGNTRGNLGGLEYDHGRYDEARAHLEAALAIHRETGARSSEGVALVNLGFLCCSQRRTEEALAHFEAALTIEREVHNLRMEGIIISALGMLHQERGEMEQARADYESAIEIHREMNDRRSEGDTLSHMASLLLRLGSIPAAREMLAKGESLLREVDAQVELGQLLCTRAEIEHGEGESARALATLREAEGLARRLGSGPDSELSRKIDELRGAFDPANGG